MTAAIPLTDTDTVGLRPSQLPRLKPGSWISLDTETSGLYPDDGARVATVSVAWNCADYDGPGRLCPDHGFADDWATREDWMRRVHGAAFPFAHGVEIQPWFSGTLALFGGDDGLNFPESEWAALFQWVTSLNLRIAMHNAQYDLIMTDAGLPTFAPAGPVSMDLTGAVGWDTFLGCRNLWPVHAKGLGPTMARLGLGKKLGDPVKDWIRKNKAGYVKQGYPSWGSGYDLVPWMLMGRYATEDAVGTLKLRQVQEWEFADGYGDWTEFTTKQMPLMHQFVAMERRGMPFPRDLSAYQVGKLETAQRKVARSLPFAPTAKAAGDFFFTTEKSTRGVNGLGLEPVKVSERTGKPSLDAEVLSDLAENEVHGAREWKMHQDLGRLASMYYGGYADKTGDDGRLRARIRQLREETKNSPGMADRFSIERVNLQAMPHDGKLAAATAGLDVPSVRSMIATQVERAYPGWGLFELDLSQAELRVGALLSECEKMLAAFHNGDDLHQITADQISVTRKTAKMSNFLLIFDGGWMTFQQQIKIQTLGQKGGPTVLTAAQAKNIVYPWKRLYPEYRKMADRWEAFARRTGYVPLANGQPRWFHAREDMRKAWNQRVQGSIAQLFQEWLLSAESICRDAEVHERAAREGIGGAGPLMTVHDSIICLLPLDIANVIVERIQAAAMAIWLEMFPGVPGAVDCKPFGGE